MKIMKFRNKGQVTKYIQEQGFRILNIHMLNLQTFSINYPNVIGHSQGIIQME